MRAVVRTHARGRTRYVCSRSFPRSVPPLVCALVRVPRPVAHEGLVYGLRKKGSITTPSLETLSRHKVFCHDRNSPPLGKLCHDTRRPLLRPKPGPAPKPCRDTEFLSQHRAKKSLLRQRKPLLPPKPPSKPGNHVATHSSKALLGARCRVVVVLASQLHARSLCSSR